VSPSPEADEELSWFFNEAEMAIDVPSNYCVLLSGVSPTDLPEVERRAEALHAAGKIRARIESLNSGDAVLLAGLYVKRSFTLALRKTLGRMAGAVEALPIVRTEHLFALARGRTAKRRAFDWLDELAQRQDPTLRVWRRESRGACAVAIRAYELARGSGPSVVPHDDEDG
jgi:hypothetical protein